MTRLNRERWYPYAVASASMLAWRFADLPFPDSEALLASTLTVSGIFVGFLATSKAILIGVKPAILRSLSTSGYMSDLVSYIGQAIWANLAFCTFNVLGYFITVPRPHWYALVWIGLAVTSLLTFIRVTRIMLRLIRADGEEQP